MWVTKLTVISESDTTTVSSYSAAAWDYLKGIIQHDIEVLNGLTFTPPKKSEWKFGEFCYYKQINAFVYHHSMHAAFASVHFSVVTHFTEYNLYKIHKFPRCATHAHHDELEPFFMDDDALELYLQEISDANRQANLKILFEKVKMPLPVRAHDLYANDWTKRLSTCLREGKIFKDLKVNATYSSKFSALVLEYNSFIVSEKVFLFHGAPDIILSKSCAIISSENESAESSAESSENDVIEVAHQRPPMHSKMEGVPEKLGEPIAALHFLLVAKFLRRIMKNKTEEEASASALLLDRINGGMVCKASMTLAASPQYMKLKITSPGGMQLNSGILCHNLQALTGKL